ncbi:hypothetical protein [Fulvivirga sp.]|uniref:hypothetical protein n=1 Tax=Fulvivirga sp. TaxID=1931237 RepID=UPI0032ED9916
MSKFKKIVQFLVVAFLLYIIVQKLINDQFDLHEIEQNLATTSGEIIDYYIIGVDSPRLTYKYEVDGKTYENTTSVFAKFFDCAETRLCIGRKFEVSYSSKNPEISEIDLNKEVLIE